MLFNNNNKNQAHVSQLETKIMYLSKVISLIDRIHDCRNGIWNNLICQVILSLCGSIYSNV